MAKDQEWGGKSFLDDNIFYPVELILVYYKDDEPFKGLVCWIYCKEEGDMIAIIYWRHIENINKW